MALGKYSVNVLCWKNPQIFDKTKMWTLMWYLQRTQTFNVRFWQRLINLFVELFNFFTSLSMTWISQYKTWFKNLWFVVIALSFLLSSFRNMVLMTCYFCESFHNMFLFWKERLRTYNRIGLDTLFLYPVNLDSNLFNNRNNSQKEFYMRSHECFNLLQMNTLELGIPFCEYNIRNKYKYN